ncbi:oxysterol binding protein [Schizosaccharomyces cryophilus OY26]|uniref:Oxysterol binding protein n=1 Tax=Schizosaccharomyces cryophilus (strain OY26 / ATCC MYA-4695 / CBS 11777 / NBRC 106824 / NRRL Y48691) TaxID=653667 RepID=S9XKQ4_SCHCR|nr:oxysterol binding protein [Schizosaccharomyces cryophilus OY26]EPY54296.1 oxysterol binding protein [Schizosaccharomyces cryophilus OY26]
MSKESQPEIKESQKPNASPEELVREDGEVEGYQKEEGKFNLPAQLLEPVGNLEYWNYVDRPDYFVTMGDEDDDLERMLAVLRWWFTKDLRFIRGRVVKPYNSVLGEFFRCKWDVDQPVVREDHTIDPESSHLPVFKTESTESTKYPIGTAYNRSSTSRAQSSRSFLGKKASKKRSKNVIAEVNASASTPDLNQDSLTSSLSDLQLPSFTSANEHDETTIPSTASSHSGSMRGRSTSNVPEKHPVVFMAEQTSHHPAVSAYIVTCPSKGVEMFGQDQISVGFTGTSFKVSPGHLNKGVYVRLKHRDNEEYLCTHPSASVGGILRGSLHINMQDSTYITCPRTRIKAIITYVEERWLGKPRSLVEGVVFRYDPENDCYDTIKSVPSDCIMATFKGNWRNCIFYNLAGDSESKVLVDLNELDLVHKRCPPLSKQFPYESRKIWFPVTQNIVGKRYSQATKAKQEIEEQQRQEAATRTESNIEWKPRYFIADNENGHPTLTEAGKKVLEDTLSENYTHEN